jgi:hypothetical protein
MSEINYILKSAVFWDVVPCGSCNNRCFGGTRRLYLRSSLADFSTLKMEATSVTTKPTCRHTPEDGILHNDRCNYLKSYNYILYYNG